MASDIVLDESPPSRREDSARETPQPRAPRRQWIPWRSRVWPVVRFTLAVLISGAVLAPLGVAAVGGLKTTGDLYLDPLGFPADPQWGNYLAILGDEFFWRSMGNSLIVVTVVTTVVVVTGCLAAFPLSRMRFRGREVVFGYFALGLLFPLAVAVLPLFVTLRELHMLDTLVGVVVVEIAFALPVTVLLLRNFFSQSVPREVEEAAYVDGCGPVGFFVRILLPMSRPGISAVAVLTTVTSWNAYFLPLLVLSDEAKWTLPLGVSQYRGEHGSDWPSIMAFVVLSLVPTVVFYLFAERHLVAGLTGGALKG